MIIIDLALPVINQVVNRYLKLDEQAFHQLQQHAGASLCIEVTNLDLTLGIIISSAGLTLSKQPPNTPTATISGQLSALINLVTNKQHPDNEVSIKGDVEFAQQVNIILSNLDIDWEEQLAKITGDIVAHKLAQHANKFKQFLTQGKRSVESNFTNYLQEEARLIVSGNELDYFCSDVTQLQQDVDRLQAKLQRYLQSRGEA